MFTAQETSMNDQTRKTAADMTFEQLWALFQEIARRQKKTGCEIKAVEKKDKEAA
jgi:hypothetical protein